MLAQGALCTLGRQRALLGVKEGILTAGEQLTGLQAR